MRKQRAFASLSEAEINQVAEWVRAQKYDDVIARVAQPRPEGFGLKVSRKPLQLLFAKVSRLEKINAHLANGTKLTLTHLDQIEAGEKSDLCEEVHDAILIATHDIATNDDCNPTQLLALQRLADFPGRAELREHKIQMDLARKEFAQQRLEIQKRHLALAEKLAEKKLRAESAPAKRNEDALGPFARNWEEVRERARKAFGITPEESARRAELRRTWVDPSAHLNAPAPDSKPDLDPSCEVPNSPASGQADVSSEPPATGEMSGSAVAVAPIIPITPTPETTNPTTPSAPSNNRTTTPFTQDQRLAEFYKGMAAHAAETLKTLNARRANSNDENERVPLITNH